jgi:undecaprenyl-phosphate galactose phosphotransferase
MSRTETQTTPAAASRAGRADSGNALRAFVWSDLLALVMCGLAGAGLNAAVNAESADRRFLIALAGTLAVVYAFRAIGHYRARQALADQIKPVLKACGLAFLMTSTAQMGLGEAGIDPGTALKWLLAPVAVIGLRYWVREGLKAERAWFEPVVLIAPSKQAGLGEALLEANDGHGLSISRSVALETFEDLTDAALGSRLDGLNGRRVFLAPDADSQAVAARIASRLSARGACFYYKPALGRIPTENLDILDAPPADGFVLRLGDSLDRPVARIVKRALDLVLAASALAVLSPVFLVVAAAIRKDGGPALFVQPRTGLGGDAFGCYKFRTMAVDAEARLDGILASDPLKRAEWDEFQKLDDDPRITRFGQLLRRTSLDELPQLINVVKGEMSLVGPRPMLMDQMALYGASLDAYVRMRPGITGLWQVNGRNATSFTERARLDDWYARNWSLWRDFVIVLRTVRELIGGSGR